MAENALVGGKHCKVYYNTGTHGSPTWVLMKRVKDLSVPQSKGEVDVSRRESKNKLTKGGLIDRGLEFGYQYKRGSDTVWTALRTSFENGTPIEFLVLDDLVTENGAKGLRAYMEVMEFPHDEPLEDGVVYNVVAKVTDYEEGGSLVEPDWFLVG